MTGTARLEPSKFIQFHPISHHVLVVGFFIFELKFIARTVRMNICRPLWSFVLNRGDVNDLVFSIKNLAVPQNKKRWGLMVINSGVKLCCVRSLGQLFRPFAIRHLGQLMRSRRSQPTTRRCQIFRAVHRRFFQKVPNMFFFWQLILKLYLKLQSKDIKRIKKINFWVFFSFKSWPTSRWVSWAVSRSNPGFGWHIPSRVSCSPSRSLGWPRRWCPFCLKQKGGHSCFFVLFVVQRWWFFL